MSTSSALDVSASQYPIGKFHPPDAVSEDDLRNAIAVIAAFPAAVRSAIAGLDESQLDTPYRDGGWTVRQLVHHVADSHINAYVRFRLALTENWPTIKPYEQALWAELADAKTLPVEISLSLLDPLHRRWTVLLESLGESDWRRGYVHPELGKMTLNVVAMQYGWHCRHHTAHVTELRKRMGW